MTLQGETRQALPWASGLPQELSSKEPTCKVGDTGDEGSVPVSERSLGGGHGNPLQCSCLEIPWTEEPGGLQSRGPHRVKDD